MAIISSILQHPISLEYPEPLNRFFAWHRLPDAEEVTCHAYPSCPAAWLAVAFDSDMRFSLTEGKTAWDQGQ
jgi:hypothetical protein